MPTAGKTSAMIMSLPDAGALIVVPSETVGHVVSQALLESRGPEFDKRCRCVAIERSADIERLAGCSTMIAWDHTFREMISSELFLEVRNYVWAHNQKFRSPAKTVVDIEPSKAGRGATANSSLPVHR